MLSILGLIIPFLSSVVDPITKITGQITDTRIAAMHAKTDEEKVAAEERTKQLEFRRDIMVAEAQSPMDRTIRFMFAFPCALYVCKLIIWDKIFELGSTDNLSDNLWYIMMTVIGFYFLDTLANKFKR